MLGVRRWREIVTETNGRTLFNRPRLTVGCSANGRRRRDRPFGPASLLYNGYRVFPGGRKRPGRDADPPTFSSAEV